MLVVTHPRWHWLIPASATAIMLWPFVFSRRPLSSPLWHHELYHWLHALRCGILPWYVAYLLLLPVFGGGREHPLERRAYEVADEVWALQLFRRGRK